MTDAAPPDGTPPARPPTPSGGETGRPWTAGVRRQGDADRAPGPRGDRQDSDGTSGRPDLRRGLFYGLGMAALFVLIWVLVAAILEIRVGVVVVAAMAGWLTGTAVALGAEPGTLRRQRSTVLLAVAVCLGTWLVGTWAAWLVSLAILPDSTLDLVGRMGNAPLLDVVGASLIPGGLLELAAVASFGWLGAR